MSDEHQNEPGVPPGPPPYPGVAPAPAAPDPWYRPAPGQAPRGFAPPQGPPGYPPQQAYPPPRQAYPPPQQGPPGYPPQGAPYYPPQGAPYYPPNAPPPPNQWGGDPGYGYASPQGYPGAAPFASYWARVGAFLLDAVILFVVSLIYLLPAHAFSAAATTSNGVRTHGTLSGGGIVVILVLEALYASLLIGLRGQTVGMMAAKIKAVDATTGGLIGFWRALGRDLFERVLGALFVIPLIVDLLFPAWDPRRQTLHDKVTNTVVIRA
ncbi:MAG: RDD family protein [Acidimicrobiales bacterium]